MMKKASILVFLLVVLFTGISSFNFGKVAEDKMLQDTTHIYKDGIYTGQSRSYYTSEPYWGHVKVTVKNGVFTDINFVVRDSNLHETFDGDYEKHFEGNPNYIQQSRNDWKGVQTYPKKMAEVNDINKVDAVSGATWSYNIFKASLNEALKSAK